MDTKVKYTETFTTTCGCYDCPNCNVLSTSDEGELKCGDCGVDMTPSDYCYEACYDYKHENWANDLFPQWLASVGNPDYVKISGKNMGWLHQEGYAVVETDWDKLYKALTINGDYRLEFVVEGKDFTAKRYSHDEPTGASFTIKPTPICGDCLYAVDTCNCRERG